MKPLEWNRDVDEASFRIREAEAGGQPWLLISGSPNEILITGLVPHGDDQRQAAIEMIRVLTEAIKGITRECWPEDEPYNWKLGGERSDDG